jgi:hypothetical protein
MGRGYLIVEGHGDAQAALHLVSRAWADLQLPYIPWDAEPIRGTALHTRTGLMHACGLLRQRPRCARVLILREEPEHCPKERGPELAAWLRQLHLPFPVAAVLLHRSLVSNETVRPGLAADVSFSGPVESVRDARKWISEHFRDGKAYKPTLDQLPMTRMLDLPALRAAEVPSFGTFERALRFLSTAGPGEVYPVPHPHAG